MFACGHSRYHVPIMLDYKVLVLGGVLVLAPLPSFAMVSTHVTSLNY
jgi:hypothetical protein